MECHSVFRRVVLFLEKTLNAEPARRSKFSVHTILKEHTPYLMKLSSLLRISFAGLVLAGLSMTLPFARADNDGGGCPSCCGGQKKCAKPSPTPATPAGGGTSTNAPSTSTNAPAKS
jgi:hypothetical protein